MHSPGVEKKKGAKLLMLVTCKDRKEEAGHCDRGIISEIVGKRRTSGRRWP